MDGRAGRTPRERTISLARTLFLERGYSATSLQNIADAVGVTKAAIYHQYPTKLAILRAVLAPAIERIESIVQIAGAADSPRSGFDLVVVGLVDLVIDHGAIASLIRLDAAVVGILAADPVFVELMNRIDRRLIGDRPTPEARVVLVLAGGGLMAVGADPSVAALDRDTRRTVLIDAMYRLLEPHRPSGPR